jgi:hypothetical protein
MRSAASTPAAPTAAAGELGALALADPGILYHHGVDTSATADR